MYEIAQEEKFYKQEYCGCVYSLRDTNFWRLQHGRQRINKGTKFYRFEDSSARPSNPLD